MTRVRVFISSPGDVAEERQRAFEVAEKLQAEFTGVLTVEALLWEQEPLLATADFQSQIRSPAEFDIFATIIGSRLGSPLGGRFTRPDGTPYASGTEYEFEVAVNSYHATGKPELLVYRKSMPVATDKDAATQALAVEQFFTRWFVDADDQTAIGAYHTFSDTQQFADLLILHLRKLLKRFLPRPNNLPTPINSFVGRRALIQSVQATLLEKDVRLITLSGPGGTGKSRLALRLARGMLSDFDDGVFLIPLAALRQADLVPATIASTLDIKQIDDRPILDRILETLRGRQLLLVIDNLEQVQSASAHISAILAACPGVKALVTSREALRITGARTIRVPPFELPKKRASTSQIRQSDVVQLFVDRARAVREDFQLTDDNAQDVLEICHRLDGLPLAIELATSRLRSMDIGRLLKAMEKRFAVLKGGADDLLDHQRSLKELITWSYELLSEEEQMLWRRMAVFVGGFTMDAAEEVCDPDDNFIVDVEAESLADKSLATITFSVGEQSEEARLSMLGTLREYALEKLREAGEYDRFQERFCQWVETLADASFEEMLGDGAQGRLELLDLEQTNIQAALDYLADTQDGADRVLRIVSGIWFYWFERGYFSEAKRLLERGKEDTSSASTLTRARSLKALGSILRFQNDFEPAKESCQKALQLYEGIDDASGRATALGELGAIALRQGNLEEAAVHLEEAMALFSTVPGHLHGRSFAAAARGVVNHLQGDLERARHCYLEALEIGSESGDSDSIASALVNLGELEEADGDPDAAYRYYQDSLKLFSDRGKKVAIAYCTEIIAGLDVRYRENPAEAALYLGFAAALRADIEAPIEPYNEQRLLEDIATTKKAMTPETFDASWQAGATLDVDEFLHMIDQR